MKTYFVSRMYLASTSDVIEAKDEIQALEIFKRNIMSGEYNEPQVDEHYSVEYFDYEDEADEAEPEQLIKIKNTMSLNEMFDVIRERRMVAC